MSPETGRRFGPYEIQARLAGGGMGHVYKAWDERLHREVAVKLLNHEFTMSGMRERFLREARAASALNHPNICTIFDIGEQDGDPYLVMELLQGETLKDRIQSRTMQVEEIVAIARDTAEALGAAHSKGVIHRDIKPANIFLVEKPNGGTQAKVLDFGLAKIEGGALGARGRALDLTTAGATVGTLAYMSPEQARGESLDSRSDLFSLGVVMYEMATRQVPFQGATSALVFVQLLNHPPEPVREWNEAIPRELEKIIFKLLAKERTARYQTARELELALLATNEKGSSSGGWLRKAAATVPLVRAPDPVARGKRLPRNTKAPGAGGTPAPRPGDLPPQTQSEPHRTSSEQFLRPVVRVPKADSSSKSELPANLASNSQSSAMKASVPTAAATLDQASKSRSSAQLPGPPVEIPLPGSQSSAGEVFPPLLAAPISRSRNKSVRDPLRIGLYFFALLIVAALAYLFINRANFGKVALNKDDAIVITEIENRTNDSAFDGSIAEALQIDLSQSPSLVIRGESSYQSARHLTVESTHPGAQESGMLLARRTASRLGAKAYMYGFISGSSAPYLLHIEVNDVATNDAWTSSEITISDVDNFSEAVDSLAHNLRLALGEKRSSVEANSTPLAQDASSNRKALQLYSQGVTLLSAYEQVAALDDFRQAVAADPKFTQAYIQLAHIDQQLRAESAAAEAAQSAVAASSNASTRTRTLAQATYDLDNRGNYAHAATILRSLTTLNPNDADSLAMLARSLSLQGRMGDALQAAQQAYTVDPFNVRAYAVAEQSLISLDRFGAAFQLDSQAQHLGLARPNATLAAAYLDGRLDLVDSIAANFPVGRVEYRPDWSYGLYLDSSGHLGSGSTLWFSRAGAARQNDRLASASTFLLAQGALDRALLGECPAAAPFLHEAESTGLPIGREALFDLGMAHALCGESTRANEIASELQQRFSQSFEVNAFQIADIRAAIAIQEANPAAAIEILKPSRAYDLISLTPYLRGRADLDLHQYQVAIVDFQTVLAHRGVTFIVGNTVYPAAQIGVARAFALSGDLGNSAHEYQAFLDLWVQADPNLQFLAEARQHLQP